MSSVSFYILNVAIRKVKGTYVACIIFLLDGAVLEYSSFLFLVIKTTHHINKEPETWLG